MAGSVTASYLAGLQGGTYIPIPVASIRVDTITGVDLYLSPGPDQPLVLYCERHLTFTEERRQRLEENRIVHLYVDSNQEQEYRRYVELNLHDILLDPTIETGEKSEILYLSAQGLIKDVMENPRIGEGIKRSKDMVSNTIQFMFGDRHAFEHLLKVTSYDYYTYTHSVNVCVYSLALAQRIGYEEPRLLQEFGNGALLHDIGKSLIDPEIINCETELTSTQWEVLRQHPVLGQDVLSKPGGASRLALDIVRHHHEKLNGSGYPDGLRSRNIHPLVRISTIADIFDALTTNRPYKRALSSFEALRLMKGEMADDLDMHLLHTFIETMGRPAG